jgi:hypothetical protein
MTSQKVERSQRLGPRFVVLLIPTLVFIGSAALAAITFFLPAALSSWEVVNTHLYLYGTASQLLMDLPSTLLLLRRGWDWLGGVRERRLGIAAGLGGAALLAGLRFALKGHLIFMEQVPAFGQALALPQPWNVLATTFTLLAYGPGEALIQVYLIRAFDEAVGHQDRIFSLGVMANAILWGLGHVGAAVTNGWSAVGNSLLMLAIGIALGLMFKRTRSAAAPIVFWTLINGTSV